jgi:hypothetical protein
MSIARRAALVAGLALAVAASACGEDATPVALPPAGAPPAEVARAYVQALDREDTAALRGLSTPHFADQAIGWLDNLEGVRLIRAEGVVRDLGGIGSARRHREVIYLPVELDLDFVDPTRSNFPADGPTHWGYVLVRDAPGEAWRVDDEGHI